MIANPTPLSQRKIRRVDIALLNTQEQIVAFVEVKGNNYNGVGAELQLQLYLTAAPPSVSFAFIVTNSEIKLYKWDSEALKGPVLILPTTAALKHYDPEFGQKVVFEDYLSTLTEAWLRDLAYHWKSEEPPFQKELTTEGFTEIFTGGSTVREFALTA